MSTKKTITWVIPIIIVTIVIIIASSIFYTVKPNEYALVIRFSAIKEQIAIPGLHIKLPFIDEVQKYPKTKIFYDVPVSDVLTSDTKAMIADSFVVWQISDPFLFFQTVNTIPQAEPRLDAAAYKALQTIISSMPQSAIVSTDERSRDDLNIAVFESVKAECTGYGIEILDVKIKRFELPPDNENSVFLRMISDRNQLAESFRADGVYQANLIRNDVDKNVNILVSDAKAEAEKIKAEGEQEYMRILAEAYNTPEREEFFKFMRGLEALKASLTGGENTVILDKDSILAQLLISPE